MGTCRKHSERPGRLCSDLIVHPIRAERPGGRRARLVVAPAATPHAAAPTARPSPRTPAPPAPGTRAYTTLRGDYTDVLHETIFDFDLSSLFAMQVFLLELGSIDL
ncbi:jg10191 [Pararge aegeria aegeria]|uniref:Jg10191 protein n=1 Tax=Pararge aegeria aegeria TaxID=348720 RepID=A0A8S4S4R4_9NEOP|nr:jg10191 [Pararge aegeria aegeria]